MQTASRQLGNQIRVNITPPPRQAELARTDTGLEQTTRLHQQARPMDGASVELWHLASKVHLFISLGTATAELPGIRTRCDWVLGNGQHSLAPGLLQGHAVSFASSPAQLTAPRPALLPTLDAPRTPHFAHRVTLSHAAFTRRPPRGQGRVQGPVIQPTHGSVCKRGLCGDGTQQAGTVTTRSGQELCLCPASRTTLLLSHPFHRKSAPESASRPAPWKRTHPLQVIFHHCVNLNPANVSGR